MSAKKKLAIGFGALAVLAGGALYGAPTLLLARAEAGFEEAACWSGGNEAYVQAPGEAFFRALDLADLAAYFPGFGDQATHLATDSAVQCLETFSDACGAIRDEAMDSAQTRLRARLGLASADTVAVGVDEPEPTTRPNWRGHVDDGARDQFCESWSAWIDWLEENQLDSAAACPVCAEIPAPAVPADPS